MSNIIDKDTKKIISTYKFLYNLIFVLGVPILALGSAVALFFALQGYGETWSAAKRSNDISTQEQKYFADYNQFLQGTVSEEAMKVHIKQGPLSFTGDLITSVDNYITYKGLVLPQNISVHKDLPLKSKDYFDDMNYSLKELKRYLNNMIKTTKEEVPPSREKNPTLSLTNADLVSYFSLSCTLADVYYADVCDVYVEDFLNVMPVYALSHDYEGLQIVFDGLKGDSAFKEKFCQQIVTYIQYTNDSNMKLSPILQECGGSYRILYDTYVAYASVQKGLQNQANTTTVFKNKDINTYKLISVQQEIYNELTSRKLNQTRITMYLQYVEELLKRDGLDPVYVDLVYWFNNDYLLGELQEPEFNLNISMQEEVKILVNEVRKINKGSSLVGYAGLATQLHGVELKQLVDADDIVVEEEKIEVTLLQRFNAKFSFASLRVDRIFMEGDDQVKIIGKLEIEGERNTKQILNVMVYFSEYRGKFIIDKFVFADSKELSRVITTIANENKMSMPQVYEYILKNRDMFADVDVQVTMCEQIKSKFKQITVVSCSEESFVFSQPIQKEKVDYTVSYENWKMSDIVVSDDDLQQTVLAEFWTTTTNEASFMGFVESLLLIRKPAEVSVDESEQADRVVIDSDFLKYLRIKTNGIMTQGDQTLVAFTLDWIQLIALYAIETHSIDALFFKKLWGSQSFTDFNFALDEDNILEIESFISDPLAYLEKIDPRIVKKYMDL